jgi:hypothetical protein
MSIRTLAIALLALGLSGCWVMGELDSGREKMDKYSAKKPEAAAPADSDAPPVRKQRVGEYFANQKNVRQLTPGQVSSDIVSCKLKSGTQYMKQTECAARGGVPAG